MLPAGAGPRAGITVGWAGPVSGAAALGDTSLGLRGRSLRCQFPRLDDWPS
jgi:hypothetical protein